MRILITFLVLGIAAVSAADFAIKENKGKNIEVSFKDRVIYRFMTERDESTPEKIHETYKVYGHVTDPLDPKGERLITKGAGGKFTHHRGIFIGFKVSADGKNADLWHMRGEARNNYIKIIKSETTDKAATLTVEVDWVWGDFIMLKEHRTVIIHAPEANGAFLLDFNTTLTAHSADAKIGGDPEHAGCHFRASQKVAEKGNLSAKYLIPAGKDVKKSNDIPWTAQTFKIDDREYHVQHMTDPMCKSWKYSAYRNYGRFGSFPANGTKLAKGESLKLRFGFYITPGAFPENAEDVKRAGLWVVDRQ